jgi:hypothetical protein
MDQKRQETIERLLQDLIYKVGKVHCQQILLHEKMDLLESHLFKESSFIESPPSFIKQNSWMLQS